jgi:hypothetical protein
MIRKRRGERKGLRNSSKPREGDMQREWFFIKESWEPTGQRCSILLFLKSAPFCSGHVDPKDEWIMGIKLTVVVRV